MSFESLNKLANTYALSFRLFNILTAISKSFNVLAIVFASSKALSKVYLNKKLKDIIQTIMKTRPTVAKYSYKYFF